MIISLLRVLLIAWECRLVIEYTHIQAKYLLRLFLVSCFCFYLWPQVKTNFGSCVNVRVAYADLIIISFPIPR